MQVGCAPDTVLEGAHQAARRVIAEGAIGRVVGAGAGAAVIDRGMEARHPSPGVFFAPGDGPVLDMGRSDLTALVSLLGPVERTLALSSPSLATRTVGRGPRAGRAIAIGVPTTVSALRRFGGDVDATFTAGWDVWSHRRTPWRSAAPRAP